MARLRASEPVVLAQGRAGVLATEEAALLEDRHDGVDEDLEALGVGRRHDVEAVGDPAAADENNRVDEPTLEAIAAATGGTFHRATDAAGLAEIYAQGLEWADRMELTQVDDAPEADSSGSKDDGSGPKRKKKTAKKPGDGPSRNPIAFVINYLREVVGELRKVIWPNRKQMASYTTVVLFFLIFMVAMIGGVDLGLAKLVTWIFG